MKFVTNKNLEDEILSLKLEVNKNEKAIELLFEGIKLFTNRTSEELLKVEQRLTDSIVKVNENILEVYRQKEDNAIDIEQIQKDISVMREWIETFRSTLGFTEIETDERDSKSVFKDGSEITEVGKMVLDSAETFDNLSDIPNDILAKAKLSIQK